MTPTVESETRLLESLPVGQLLGGRWIDYGAGGFPVHDPATGERLLEVGRIPECQASEVVHAVVAGGQRAARMTPRERSDLLFEATAALIRRADEFALLITMEMGKPLAEARAEVAYAAEFLRWFAEEVTHVGGEYRVLPDGSAHMLTARRPVGECLLITPWNFPLAMATRKVAPAIAAGCASVLKPAELTPLTTLLFARLLEECGIPDGVLNVVLTDDPARLVTSLIDSRAFRKLSFTGSTEVGRHLAAQAGPHLLRTSFELGGNAPFLVFPDGDLDAAADGFMLAKFRNGGAACTAANRLLVHRDVFSELVDVLGRRIGALRLGRGTAPGVTLGPMISPAERDRFQSVVDQAVRSGAWAIGSTEVPDGGGNFAPPSLVLGADPGSPVVTSELFGPSAAVLAFDTEEQATRLANATPYGLVAYVFTSDHSRVLRMVHGLGFGMLGINRGVVSNAAAPFGGVKSSGLGREGSHEGLLEYQELVYAAMNSS